MRKSLFFGIVLIYEFHFLNVHVVMKAMCRFKHILPINSVYNYRKHTKGIQKKDSYESVSQRRVYSSRDTKIIA